MDKGITPVSWLMEEITYDDGYGERMCSFIECVGLSEYFDKALQMEALKQQKYDEMVKMLNKASDALCSADADLRKEIEQLITEANKTFILKNKNNENRNKN